MIHHELRCSRGARETLVNLTEKEDCEYISRELISLLFKARGGVTEREVPRHRVEKLQAAVESAGLSNSIRIAYAGSIKSQLRYGDVNISLYNRFDERIIRIQLDSIAKMSNSSKAIDAFIAFMEQENYGFTIDKFPYETFSRLEALTKSVSYKDLFTLGFAFTIKNDTQESYGTAFFSMERTIKIKFCGEATVC